MLEISDELKKKFREGRVQHVRIYTNFPNVIGGTVHVSGSVSGNTLSGTNLSVSGSTMAIGTVQERILTDDDIMEGTLNVDRFVTETSMTIGTAVSSQLSFDANNFDGRFLNVVFEGKDLEVEIGVDDTWLKLGKFIVSERPKRNSIMHIVAMDHMIAFDRPITLNFGGKTMHRIMEMVCETCNISMGTNLSFMENSTITAPWEPEFPEGATYRDIVKWVGQILCANAYIGIDGRLYFSWFNNTDEVISTDVHMNASEDDLDADTIYRINGINIDDVHMDLGFDFADSSYYVDVRDYTLKIENNPLVDPNLRSAIILGMRRVLQSAYVFRAFDVATLPMPWLEPLDTVRIEMRDSIRGVIPVDKCVITHVNHGFNLLSAVNGADMASEYMTSRS